MSDVITDVKRVVANPSYNDRYGIPERRGNGEDAYMGIEIATSEEGRWGFINVLISDISNCLEEWGVTVFDSNGKSTELETLRAALVGKTLASVRVGKDDEIGELRRADDDDDDDAHYERDTAGRSVTVELTLDDGAIYKVLAHNFHNGYYPHAFIRSWKGYYNDGEL